MNTREQLNDYLRSLEKRLRWETLSKGAAIAAGVALGATIALALITNALAFSSTSMAVARVVLFLSLAVALGFALLLPLVRLNQRRAASRAERAFPQFQERLLTYVERRSSSDPMLELLAADTQHIAQSTTPANVAPPRSIFAFATSAGAAGAVLMWLILAGPGFLGYGASLLWGGLPSSGARAAFYEIQVDPGNRLVRRKADQMITAQLMGFQSDNVKLFAKYKSSSKWEEARMLPRANGSTYEFVFAALPEPVSYYVEASTVKSKTYQLDVIDLPAITKVKVTYHYPSWLGQKDETEDPGGDLRAVVGTVAEVVVQTDRPLKSGVIEMEDGSRVNLDSGANGSYVAKVTIQKDGLYHFGAMEQGQSVRLSQDYFIEAREDGAPSVKITHPGADARVSPIEEVTINVQAEDDFAVQEMELHYSVNGSPEQVENLLKTKGVRAADGSTTLYLENFKLSPGDVISMYATAKDAHTVSRTDMMFVEAEPYERNYSQAQSGGGGGGGGGGQQDQQEISRRQKEIITATFNAIRGGPKDRAATPENAEFLAEVQTKLKAQAESLAQRATSRELAGANQEFQSFVKDMQEAAAQMGPASDKLKKLSWKDALEPEQKALQHLLRAEATFRDIQVAFGNNKGGGGGGGASAGRDLANLFDLELDTEKNQYEQGQQASSQEQKQKDMDTALQKLDELARRQQQLAQQQQNGKQATPEQRFEQERLKREAEQLQKQIEQMQQQQSGQLSRNGQGGQSSQQSGQQSNQQQNQQNQQPGSKLQQLSSANQTLQKALDRLKQAQEDMRAAQQANSQQGQQAQAEANARRAADRLQEGRDALNGMRRQDESGQLNDLADRADKLAQQQKDFENKMKQTFGDPSSQNGRQPQRPVLGQTQELAQQKDALSQQVDQLQKDMQKTAQSLAGTQPNAASRLRDGLSALQQQEVTRRMQATARNIRQGAGAYMTPGEAPVTRAMEQARDDIKNAQQAMQSGNQQAQGQGEMDRSIAQVERLRNQFQRLQEQARAQQQGQQNGNQPGGQQGNGQQAGNQGGNQQGGNRFGAGNRGGRFGGYGGFDRYNPDGVYDVPDDRNMDPAQIARVAQRDLEELRQQFKDDPDLSKQIEQVERDLQRTAAGDVSSPELQQRLSRTVLPSLESLETQLRRNAEEKGSGQVRSGIADKTPPGFSESVADYFRRLSKGK